MTAVRNRRVATLGRAKILKRKDISSELRLLWLGKPEGYIFKAGQYCTIGVNGIERAYSIVSAPHEDFLEIFVELVPPPEGNLTPLLWSMEVGESVTIRPRAKGLFTMDPTRPNQMLIATVTGIVPYVSFIRDYVYNCQEGHHFYVLQGASYQDEFTYDQELMQLSHENRGLITFIPTISRPTENRNKGWMGELGRVNLIVEGHVDKLDLAPEDTMIYACGHPGMIEDVKEKLVPRGFKVIEERFWKED